MDQGKKKNILIECKVNLTDNKEYTLRNISILSRTIGENGENHIRLWHYATGTQKNSEINITSRTFRKLKLAQTVAKAQISKNE